MKVLSSASARPNFVKLAALHHALRAHDGIEHVIVHTGQHYDPLFSDIFFSELSIPTPSYNLGIKTSSSREETIRLTAEAMTPVLEKEKPDIVLVYGDVNGALGAARSAHALGLSVCHVEAGLRSGDLSMPEERNRIEIDEIADDLFVTEISGQRHLLTEGVRGHVHFVGNTMIDTLVRMMPSIEKAVLPITLPPAFAVATFHRPSNVDTKEALTALLTFLSEVAEHIPVIFPLHRRTQAMMESFGLRSSLSPNILIVEPLGYIEFLSLVQRSAFILTDSGGIQEEATFLEKRCFTLRRNTERPSTIDSGSNVLIDPEHADERASVIAFAKHPSGVSVTIPPLWDGKAGERIVDVLQRHLDIL